MNRELVLKKLHPKQDYIIKNAKRFNHLRCGRRFGKTTIIEELASPSVGGKRVGVWFPTYKDLSDVWKDLKYTYRNVITSKNEQLHQIITIGKGIIDFWSLEDPESGQGRKYNRAIVDEAAKANKLYYGWEHTIRPTLTDYSGDAYILSRPKGKNNGFHELEVKHRKFDNWAFFHYTTYDNPFIPVSEIEEAKQQLDSLTFNQEYLAEYIDAADRPFLYAFIENKHVIEAYSPNPHLPLTISFDFNKDPMTCLIGQVTDIKTLYIFDEIKIENGSTPELCERIVAKYPSWLGNIYITGDASGNNRSPLVRGGVNHYILIKKALGVRDNQFLVRRSNLSHVNSRILCNSVLQNANFRITKNCKETIADCVYASVDEEGELIKTVKEGRHFFDNVRYMIDCRFPQFISHPDKYR
jgi:hypothetical protein